jgi:hypothetical protein
VAHEYPALDRSVVIDFGEDGPFGPFAATLSFRGSDGTVSFLVTRGSLTGKAETLPFAAAEIAEGIWLVTWQEEDLLTVVQVQDFTTGRLTSAVTTADQQFVKLDGTIAFA